MTVGELPRRTGMPVKALREHTDWGVICIIGSSGANYRLSHGEALWCVQAISELRGLGLKLGRDPLAGKQLSQRERAADRPAARGAATGTCGGVRIRKRHRSSRHRLVPYPSRTGAMLEICGSAGVGCTFPVTE